MLDDTDEARDGSSVGVDGAGVPRCSSSLSSSSSSPMAKVPSSGTSLSSGALEWLIDALLMLSADPRRLSLRSCGSLARSFLRLFLRSISCWPLSRVKDRNAKDVSPFSEWGVWVAAYLQISSYSAEQRTQNWGSLKSSLVDDQQAVVSLSAMVTLTSGLKSARRHGDHYEREF